MSGEKKALRTPANGNCKCTKIVKKQRRHKMDNELIIEKSWWQRNWKWFLPASCLFLVCITLLIGTNNGLTDFAQTYADSELCQNAINEANKNDEVIEDLGKLEPIDKFAIMEGNSVYSNSGKNVEITVRISGQKGKAKMDISAEKLGETWNYKIIKIRIKNPEKEILILKNIQ